MGLLSSVLGYMGQSSAENQLNNGIRAARNTYQTGYDDIAAMKKPYIEPGKNAYADWATALAGDMTGFNDSAFGKSYADYGINRANEALQTSAASRGLLNSGATMKAIQENTQNMANQDYGQRLASYLSNLGGLGGASSSSADTLASYRDALASNLAGLDLDAAGIAAQGKLNKYNAIGSGVSSITSAFGL